MSTVEILIFVGLVWMTTASVIALVLCARLKRDNSRERLQCKFDPVSVRGIERGDLRGVKLGGRR